MGDRVLRVGCSKLKFHSFPILFVKAKSRNDPERG